jgi:hypothetical protein
MTACPHCGYMVDTGTHIATATNSFGMKVDETVRPVPGNISVCLRCAGVSQYTSEMTLVPFDVATLDPEAREIVEKARWLILEKEQGVPWPEGVAPKSPFGPGYSRALHRLDDVVGGILAISVEVPLFAFPPKGIAIAGDLGDNGRLFARNAAARAVLARAVSRDTPAGERPTLIMLRAVLETRGIPIEEVSLSELGIHLPGVVPGPPS